MLEFPSTLPPQPTRPNARRPSAERDLIPRHLGSRKMRRFINDNFIESEIEMHDGDDEPYEWKGTTFSNPAVLMMISEEEFVSEAKPRIRQAPAPCPEGATRIAGRASAMFGRLDKSARATLLAFAGHPQLDEAEAALRAYLRACIAGRAKGGRGGREQEPPRRRGARRRGRAPPPPSASSCASAACRPPPPPPVTLPATESEGLRAALRAACTFYCLQSRSVVGRTRTAPRATLAQLQPPGSEERWSGLQAASDVSLVALLAETAARAEAAAEAKAAAEAAAEAAARAVAAQRAQAAAAAAAVRAEAEAAATAAAIAAVIAQAAQERLEASAAAPDDLCLQVAACALSGPEEEPALQGAPLPPPAAPPAAPAAAEDEWVLVHTPAEEAAP